MKKKSYELCLCFCLGGEFPENFCTPGTCHYLCVNTGSVGMGYTCLCPDQAEISRGTSFDCDFGEFASFYVSLKFFSYLSFVIWYFACLFIPFVLFILQMLWYRKIDLLSNHVTVTTMECAKLQTKANTCVNVKKVRITSLFFNIK